jgi:hypothetical protein
MIRIFVVAAFATVLGAQTPVEPIAAIVEAFRTHSIVAIGNVEFRGNEQCQAFHRALIRDPRIAAVVNDIVVEFGSARYQDVIDRFVRGEDVPPEALRRVWQNTTQVEIEWDLPVYEEFFRTVRTVNASLPRARQLRVILGDPPIDWDKVRTLDDLHKEMGDRDAHAVEVIRREVLAKNRRALVIYGGQHLLRKNTVVGAASEWASGIVARLEKDKIASVFTVLPETRRDLRAQIPNVASWPVPSLAIVRGTTLGTTIWDQGPQRRPVALQDQVDAILYLGPPASMTTSKLSTALCADRSYMAMRIERMNLLPRPPGAPSSLADQLKEYCANPAGPAEIPDRQPAITEMLRKTLRDAAQGKVDPENIAPESRDRVTTMLQRDGPRFLGPAGALASLTLVGDTNDGKHVRRYRSVFASGLSILWTVELTAAGKIAALSPRPE